MTSIKPKQRGGLAAKSLKELKAFLGIVAYLFVVFGFYALADDVFRRREGLSFSANGFALIHAVVFGKIILVGEQLRFGQWLRRAPLAYAIVLESSAFALLLMAVHFAERAALAYVHGGKPTLSLDVGGGGWLGLAIIVLMLFIALVPFFAYRNLSRLIGPENFHALLFRARRG